MQKVSWIRDLRVARGSAGSSKFISFSAHFCLPFFKRSRDREQNRRKYFTAFAEIRCSSSFIVGNGLFSEFMVDFWLGRVDQNSIWN